MRVPVQKTEASSAVRASPRLVASPRGAPLFATVVVTVGHAFFTTDHSNAKHHLCCNKYHVKCDITSSDYLFPRHLGRDSMLWL